MLGQKQWKIKKIEDFYRLSTGQLFNFCEFDLGRVICAYTILKQYCHYLQTCFTIVYNMCKFCEIHWFMER